MTAAADKLLSRLPKVRGTYRSNALLSKTNWFGVGGPADVLFRPEDADDLAFFMKHKPRYVPVSIIGVGSNLLVRDGGVEGVVIKLGRGFAGASFNGDVIQAGAAALDFNVATLAQQAAIGKLEFLSGIPGTIGGGLAMNAGAYGSDMASVLIRADVMDEMGNIYTVSPREIGFVYRGNTLPEGWIFTKAILQGERTDKAIIAERMAEITAKRESTQPVKTRTSGSTFANPEGYKAWELIDKAGCRGLRIGNAMVSEKHCNFLINLGEATAEDLESLGEEVRKRVKETTGVTLEWEVRRIGRKEGEQSEDGDWG